MESGSSTLLLTVQITQLSVNKFPYTLANKSNFLWLSTENSKLWNRDMWLENINLHENLRNVKFKDFCILKYLPNSPGIVFKFPVADSIRCSFQGFYSFPYGCKSSYDEHNQAKSVSGRQIWLFLLSLHSNE
jgi:hypothetical protein